MVFTAVELIARCPVFDMVCKEKDNSSLFSPSRLMICLAFKVARTELLYTA